MLTGVAWSLVGCGAGAGPLYSVCIVNVQGPVDLLVLGLVDVDLNG